jgi:hypothetical protein
VWVGELVCWCVSSWTSSRRLSVADSVQSLIEAGQPVQTTAVDHDGFPLGLPGGSGPVERTQAGPGRSRQVQSSGELWGQWTTRLDSTWAGTVRLCGWTECKGMVVVVVVAAVWGAGGVLAA